MWCFSNIFISSLSFDHRKECLQVVDSNTWKYKPWSKWSFHYRSLATYKLQTTLLSLIKQTTSFQLLLWLYLICITSWILIDWSILQSCRWSEHMQSCFYDTSPSHTVMYRHHFLFYHSWLRECMRTNTVARIIICYMDWNRQLIFISGLWFSIFKRRIAGCFGEFLGLWAVNLHPAHRRERWVKEEGRHLLCSLFCFSLLFTFDSFNQMPNFFLE